jgi:hypothetical protein
MTILQERTDWGGPLLEQRQGDRKMFRTFAQLTLPNGAQLTVRTYDVGLDGISIIAPVNLKLKSGCEIVFKVPIAGRGSDGIHAAASVAHSILSRRQDGFMIGLDFRSIQERDLAFIRAYVNA